MEHTLSYRTVTMCQPVCSPLCCRQLPSHCESCCPPPPPSSPPVLHIQRPGRLARIKFPSHPIIGYFLHPSPPPAVSTLSLGVSCTSAPQTTATVRFSHYRSLRIKSLLIEIFRGFKTYKSCLRQLLCAPQVWLLVRGVRVFSLPIGE